MSPAPTNDNIANATLISGSSGSAGPITIDDATVESGETYAFGSTAHQTIWFRFTPTTNGTATFSTWGSLAGDAASGDGTPGVGSWGYLDTRLGLYSGSPGSLTILAANDDYVPGAGVPHSGDGDVWSYLSHSVTAGTTYYLQASTFTPSSTGTVMLTWTLPVPVPDCIQLYTWGYTGLTQNEPDGSTLNAPAAGSEPLGYVKCGAGFSMVASSPQDGSLLLATVSRYSIFGAMPATGTLSGFGATWERIYYQEATGSGGAAFSEVWRAQQATYATPDFLTYSFTPGAFNNGVFDSVGFFSLTGTPPTGLADNGASAIRNVVTHGPTASTAAFFSQTTPYLNESNLMYHGFWRMSDNGSAGTSDTVASGFTYFDDPFNPIDPIVYGSGRGGVANWGTADDSDAIVEIAGALQGSTVGYTWPAGLTRTWWAASFELLADPACAGVLNPYWGINATTVIPF